jgi:alcohol dehydrogenase
MPALPADCRALVYDPGPQRLRMRRFPLRDPGRGEVIVRVTLSSLCRSDLHTVSGRRSPGGPLVLGHEIVGEVAAVGESAPRGAAGKGLDVGDRVTWSIAASCGECFFCTHRLPQKCVSLFKYGHRLLSCDPPLSGGFAEYCYLAPGTTICRLPDDLPDASAVFANCAVATAAAIVRQGQVQAGDSVLIQGAGLLGLSVAALSARAGAAIVAVSDVSTERLARAAEFGATHTLDASGNDSADLLPHGRGFDLAVEVCGQAQVIPSGIAGLRTGGAYIIAGCVYPGATAELDMQNIIFKHLRLQGVHNYIPEDLRTAVDFLTHRRGGYGFDGVVAEVYALDQWEQAFARAEQDPTILRVAIAP